MKAAKMVLDTIKRRDELKVAFGDRYSEHIALAVKAVRIRASLEKEDALHAALALAKEAGAKGEDVAAQFFLCAWIEIEEEGCS